jgi:methionine-gamma-lyase
MNVDELGMGTLLNHVTEGKNPLRAHVAPIYQTSVFSFPDVATGAAIFRGEEPGYTYTRTSNPNITQLEAKIALLESLDLLKGKTIEEAGQVAQARVFASGMAAVSSAILASVQAGQTFIAQRSLYGNTFSFLDEIAPRCGITVAYVDENSREGWSSALHAHPDAALLYAETPSNPTMELFDLQMLADLAREHGCWLMVDNTFATPYCQRPLTLGADVVVHSTTKYISGHGVIIGGAVVSTHLDYIQGDLHALRRRLGGAASPFDAWLTNLGLRTFELRMERHCANAMAVAQYLATQFGVEKVYYPGLPDHPGHDLARKQMHAFGGMLSFELDGGFDAAERMLNNVRIATLAVSLGNVDTLIEHPAGMTHSSVPAEVRREMGIYDGLVRLSVGIENVEDIIGDLDQAINSVARA